MVISWIAERIVREAKNEKARLNDHKILPFHVARAIARIEHEGIVIARERANKTVLYEIKPKVERGEIYLALKTLKLERHGSRIDGIRLAADIIKSNFDELRDRIPTEREARRIVNEYISKNGIQMGPEDAERVARILMGATMHSYWLEREIDEYMMKNISSLTQEDRDKISILKQAVRINRYLDSGKLPKNVDEKTAREIVNKAREIAFDKGLRVIKNRRLWFHIRDKVLEAMRKMG